MVQENAALQFQVNEQGDFQLLIHSYKIVIPKDIPDDVPIRIRTPDGLELRIDKVLDKDNKSTWNFEQVSEFVPDVHSHYERHSKEYPPGLDGL